jgi:hypothetical protein
LTTTYSTRHLQDLFAFKALLLALQIRREKGVSDSTGVNNNYEKIMELRSGDKTV